MTTRAVLLFASLLSSIGIAGCQAGAAGKAAGPTGPTAAGAMGELRCQEGQVRAEPLVVDWGSNDRVDLEVAMRDGVVVENPHDVFTDPADARGARLLYVAMTRAVQTLHFVSTAPLPPELTAV